MGFGTLFIGYFLILNLTYFGYTDTIAALIMMLGLYRLSSVNRDFKFSMVFSIAYALIGTVELFEAVYSMFNPSFNTDVLVSYVAPFRYLAIGFLTAFMLLGINTFDAISSASSPDTLITATPPLPGGVEIAAIVDL